MNYKIEQAARMREIEHAAFLESVLMAGLLPAYTVRECEEFFDIACESCAVSWAVDQGLTYESAGGYYHGVSDGDTVDVSPIWPGDNETDYPSSCCWCGYFVECRLTRDGEDYVRENMPSDMWYLWGVDNAE